ncbi:MAG TPA: hypothetical protein DDZ80_09555 [Cyanobacteria bacterium UBA8803]|nr:hypothetical protein [Cyanobacteria bacterium UBA9273]HBL58743.1 hypothetical protein [Cyanobacteria bacterium UBA8803]
MHLFFRLIGFKSTFLLVFLPEVALTNPLSVNSQFPVIPNSEVDTLVCYMETEDGQILNLESLCKKANPDSENRPSNSVNTAQCFLVDPDGRPCPTTKGDRQNDTLAL